MNTSSTSRLFQVHPRETVWLDIPDLYKLIRVCIKSSQTSTLWGQLLEHAHLINSNRNTASICNNMGIF
uniref:Uncharacterized protein n=1 Tax=Anguilla anguilla TaxID=7936 RepID=A0A0E9UC10_ANGAN